MANKELHFWNEFHLGDHVFTCIYFHTIKDYIEKENIKVFYHISETYISQISEFIPSDNFVLCNLTEQKKGINIWIGSNEVEFNWWNYTKTLQLPVLDTFLVCFFNKISEKVNIPIIMNEFKYADNDLLLRYEGLSEKYKDIDILIINSEPRSYQVEMTPHFVNDMNKTICDLNNKYKIVTTYKLEGIPCTSDDNYTIKTIAAISTHAKIIIAINTGPTVGIFNEFTLNNIKKVYYIDVNNSYHNNKFERIHLFSEVLVGTSEIL